MQDNINLDLNESTIRVLGNDLNSYRIVLFDNVTNGSISNGTIIGDRELHTYTDSSTLEHGMGVAIINESNNVTVTNLNISNVTGDGVYISNCNGSIDTEKIDADSNHSINIINNDIHYFRRNGISIISGNDIYIYNNEIHDCEYIEGSVGHDANSTSPRGGIDFERNSITEMYSNIFIVQNKIYDVYGRLVNIEDSVKYLTFSNNQISKELYFTKDLGKALEAVTDNEGIHYTEAVYTSFMLCNDYDEFKSMSDSVISNNSLIDINLVKYSSSSYYTTNSKLFEPIDGEQKNF